MGSGLTKNSSSQQLRCSANSSLSSETVAWMNGARCPLRLSKYAVQSQPWEDLPRFTNVERKSMPSLEAKDNEKTTERRLKILSHESTSSTMQTDGESLRRASSLPVGTHASIDSHQTFPTESVLEGTHQKKNLLKRFLHVNEPFESESCRVDSQESNESMAPMVRERWKTFMNTHPSKISSQSLTIPVECSSSKAAAEHCSHHISVYDERVLNPLLEKSIQKHADQYSSRSPPPLTENTPKCSSSRQQKPSEDNQQQVSTFNAEMSTPSGNCIIKSNHKSGNTLVRTLSTKSLSKVVPTPIQVFPKDSPHRLRGEPPSTFHSLQSLFKKINHSQSALGFRSLFHPLLDKQMLEKVPLLTVTRPDEPPCYSHLPPSLRNDVCLGFKKKRQFLDVM
ncbi:hypothetical protein FDP41_009734 [Naegleria fowleri]|uniref:Uncharacterized protein n=1 Tax=Naegleria fowleri TaxID=5763 RepID=A0A6A5BDP6_NAEFO|nr:uncharacterized protein FDP41_009734 [Naegleria fowleri]KAF0972038.1 hypothetical protein FDP41_009734 [Naegleria fowleri]CAG4716105.1 unnamed protein product [Naegleria fowleri]